MAGTLKVDTIQSSASATPPVFKDSGGIEVGQLCRAWVNFNGSGGAAIRASYNVSSVTRTAVGTYTLNFTNALADANYCLVFGNSELNSSSQARFANGYPISSSQAQIYCSSYIGGTTIGDGVTMSVAAFR